MTKVITYGTYDLLHYGHIRLLERAKALGDYLIVGVTADDFDKTRGKINVTQSLMERVEGVRRTGLADEIIIEEYEGQNIDDIRKYNIDIFTVGSDWRGKFDYLKAYCEVVYLERTKGISSTEIRDKKRKIKIGLLGDSRFLNKIEAEARYVNGVAIIGVCSNALERLSKDINNLPVVTEDYDQLIDLSDALYIRSNPHNHYSDIKKALDNRKNILCESPMVLSTRELRELMDEAESSSLVLMEAIKTAYSTAYKRLLLLIKTGIIGDIYSVDVTCTSLIPESERDLYEDTEWDCLFVWGPTALLPIFQILGTGYKDIHNYVRFRNTEKKNTGFIKSDFYYENAVASLKIGNIVKSEGELIISGTKGYIYVPAPWWKTDYFEIRFEDPNNNKRYFYQLDGEGIRYELVAFAKDIETGTSAAEIDTSVSYGIASYMEKIIKEYSLS